MHRDPVDPRIVWMTEKELRALGRPKRMWLLILAVPAGFAAAQLLVWLLGTYQ